jgi:hypothetical protein
MRGLIGLSVIVRYVRGRERTNIVYEERGDWTYLNLTHFFVLTFQRPE